MQEQPPSHAFRNAFRNLATCWLPQIVFWGWNALFLAVAAFGIAPRLAEFVFENTLRGDIPWSFTGGFLLLLAVPPASIVVGILWRRRPGRLIRFFYGIEGPVFVLCLLRILLLRELNPALIFVLSAFVTSAFFYTAYLAGRSVPSGSRWAMAQLAGTTLIMITGLYIALLLLFYMIPLGGFMTREAFSSPWLEELVEMIYNGGFLLALMAILFWISALLVLAMPVALPWLYIEAWRRRFNDYVRVLGQRRTLAVSGGVVALALLCFVAVNRQPQLTAFERLRAEMPSAAEKRRLLANSEHLRRGLQNAYLASYRYVSSAGENTHVRAMWQETFGGDYETYTGVENVYNFLARPLLYDGKNLERDRNEAAELYAEFFDAPIQKAERQSISRALEATWERGTIEAGFLDIDKERVRVVQQDIQVVNEAGGWAEIELYEVYRNTTWEQQEILYSFALPETAAITGLWLGTSAERDRRDRYVVSTRGAAQAVYREQVVRYRVDPALVEQIGPRQYRLRAFPVPPLPMPDAENDEPQDLHLWMTFQVSSTSEGWPLPRLLERRNVAPQRQDWMPGYLARDSGSPPRKLEALVAGHRVTALPAATFDPRPEPRGDIAAILDTSRSMAAAGGDLEAAFARLRAIDQSEGSEVDLYVADATGAPSRLDDWRSFDPGEILFYGKLLPRELLAQFTALRAGKNYRAVMILTDDGAYDFADNTDVGCGCPEPVWMIHLGEHLPAGYDDALLAAVEGSGGGVATSVNEVAGKISAPAETWMADGFLWSAVPVADGETLSLPPKGTLPATGFEPVAARQLIRSWASELVSGDLKRLDRVHAVAQRYGVVTPYSSMIVLVNQRQRDALSAAEQGDDRFERETETGQESLDMPDNPFEISGVPEPEEWILIIMAGFVLMVVARMKLL